MPSTSRRGNKKEVAAEMRLRASTEGMDESISKVSKFGRAIEQLSNIHKSSVARSKEFDWATQLTGKAQGILQSEVLRTNYLYRKYEDEIHDVAKGLEKASSLTNDQVDVMKELFKATDRILKSKRAETELNDELRKNLDDIRERTGKAILEFDRMEEKHKGLSIVAERLGQSWSESFGQLKTGAKEADQIIGLIKNSFSKLEPAIKPHLDHAKRIIKEAFAEKLGIKVDKTEIDNSIKRFNAEMAKKAATPSKGDAALESKIQGYLPSKTPGKGGVGDLKDMVDAAEKLSKSGTKAGAGMSKASKGMVGVTKAGTKAGAVTTGVGKAMAKTGAKTAAKVGTMTALKGAIGAIIPPLGLLLLALEVLSMGLSLLSGGFTDNIESMEKFRQAGYRASGSIRDLINTSADLSRTLGASSEQADATVLALTEAGFAVSSLGEKLRSTEKTSIGGQQALLRLSQANFKFSDATGASSVEVAKLQKRLTAMNTPIEEQEAALGALSQAAEKYMLTGSDLDTMIQGLRKSSVQMEVVWSSTNIYDYTQAMGELAGAAKTLGVDMSVAAQAMDDVSKATDKALMLAAAGGNLGALFGTDQTAALQATAEGAQAVLDRIGKYKNAVKAARVAEVYGGVEYLKVLAATGEALKIEAQRRAALGEEGRAREDMMIKSREALTASYNKSTETMSKAFQRLAAPITAIFKKIAGPLVDAATGLANYFVPVLEEIGSAFNILWDGIVMVFTPFIPFFKVIGKLFGFVLVAAIFIITTAIKGLGLVLGGIGVAFQWIMDIINPLFERMSRGFDNMIKKVREFGKALGEGWANFKGYFGFVDEKLLKKQADGLLKASLAAKRAKRAMSGSSFLHIKEGIRDVLPSLDKLSTGFDKAADSAIKAKESATGSSFLRIKEGVNEVLPSMNKLITSFLFPEQARKEEGEKPMSMYSVKFKEDMMQEQAESAAITSATTVKIYKLMQILAKVAAEGSSKEAIEELNKALNDLNARSKKKDEEAVMPDQEGVRRASGENMRSWWELF